MIPRHAPEARIRTEVTAPSRFVDGYQTTARVFTFDGLVDSRERLALGLGDRSGLTTSSGGAARHHASPGPSARNRGDSA